MSLAPGVARSLRPVSDSVSVSVSVGVGVSVSVGDSVSVGVSVSVTNTRSGYWCYEHTSRPLVLPTHI